MSGQYVYLAMLTVVFVGLAAVGFWASERERRAHRRDAQRHDDKPGHSGPPAHAR